MSMRNLQGVIRLPKTRSSGTLAQGNTSNLSSGELREMTARVETRLNNASNLNLNLASRGAVVSNEVTDNINELRNIDALSEEERNLIFNEEDDGFFYTDEENEEIFNETLERAVNSDITYEYENVLNGSSNTFGIELEFVDGDADAIARELYGLGIVGHPRRVSYHARNIQGKWKLEYDGSVCSGSKGGELVSPVLTDTPETWRTIEKICEVAKRYGAKVNQKCGGHVHIGIEPLDTARQRWRRFFKTIAGFEDVLYRVSGGNLGRIRSGYSRYASPFSSQARSAAVRRFRLDSREDVNNLARTASGRNRYFGINLTNIYERNKPNTVEFRYFNGSLDPGNIQANVKVSNGIIMAAQKARTQDSDTYTVTENHKKRGKILNEQSSYDNDRTTHTGIRKFVDIVFSRKKDKDNLISVYSKNRWAF